MLLRKKMEEKEVFTRGGVSVYGRLISAAGFRSANKSNITKLQNTRIEPMGVKLISSSFLFKENLWLCSNAETPDQLRSPEGLQVVDLPFSLTRSTLLHFIVSRWVPGLMSQRRPFLLCCALLPVQYCWTWPFSKPLFNQRWFVVDQANGSIAFTAPAPKLAALHASCEHTAFWCLGPICL